MQSRLIHLDLITDVELWLKWANFKGINFKVTGFVQSFPKVLDSFDPNHTDKTFACGRTLEFTSDLTKSWKEIDTNAKRAIVHGTLGTGVANEFIAYSKICGKLPTFKQIIADPENTNVPDEPSVLYAMTNMISEYSNDTDLGAIFTYITRLPLEFQVTCIKSIRARHPEIQGGEQWNKWVAANIHLLRE
jgi:hypothetical protein